MGRVKKSGKQALYTDDQDSSTYTYWFGQTGTPLGFCCHRLPMDLVNRVQEEVRIEIEPVIDHQRTALFKFRLTPCRSCGCRELLCEEGGDVSVSEDCWEIRSQIMINLECHKVMTLASSRSVKTSPNFEDLFSTWSASGAFIMGYI